MVEQQVAEIQGLHGPFEIPERFLQRLWLRGRFDAERLALTDGRPLRVADPGRWNHLGGPDFRDARLIAGDQTVRGDVEVHFYPGDWFVHGHDKDADYARVVLHVTLFPGPGGHRPVRTAQGEEPLHLVLLPFLPCDLEELAEEEALEALDGGEGPGWRENLRRLPGPELEARLRRLAGLRWSRKVAAARQLLDRLGWEEALHRRTLEILGYARNAWPMGNVAACFSLENLRRHPVRPEALFDAQRGCWKLQGLRPANHPLARLRQYAGLLRDRPDWPRAARAWAEDGAGAAAGAAEGGGPEGGPGEADTRAFRRECGLPGKLERLRADLLGGHLGGTRFLTWVNDGLWPLAAAAGAGSKDKAARASGAIVGRSEGGGAREAPGCLRAWWHGPPGDAPEGLVRLLRDCRPGAEAGGGVQANGWLQGMLGCAIEEETGCRQLEFSDLLARPG